MDGAPLDIGGGHFLDIKHKEVLDLLFRFMPESEWNRHDCVSKIHRHLCEGRPPRLRGMAGNALGYFAPIMGYR